MSREVKLRKKAIENILAEILIRLAVLEIKMERIENE